MGVTVDETTGEILDETPAPEPEPDEPGAADDDAPDAQPESEPEPEPAPDQPSNEVLQEAVFDKAIKRAKTYMSAVPDILGPSAADLAICPRCTDLLPGWILPLQVKPVTLEQKVAVKLSIGELAEPQLRQADDAFECGKCGGEGEVLTGSKVVSQRKARCLECQGRGWVGARAAKLAQLPADQQQPVDLNGGQPDEAQPVADPWGRTIDDPLYGIMPGFERA